MHVSAIKTEIRLRPYDKKYQLLGYVPDPTFKWSEYSSNPVQAFTPYIWVTLGVFDDHETAKKARQKTFTK